MIDSFCKFINRSTTFLYSKFLSPLFFSIGEKTRIMPPLRFARLSAVELGKNVTIHNFCWIQTIDYNDNKPKLIIKDHVGLGMFSQISAANKIVIEEYVFTAPNVYISDHGHEYNNIEIPIGLQGIRKVSEIRIGAYSWIGRNAAILPGGSIGKHCIIGANSVVNGPIPDFCIAVGLPAKVIRRYNKEKAVWERT